MTLPCRVVRFICKTALIYTYTHTHTHTHHTHTVPSANKRDLRSIEQTLDDMRSRKKPKLEEATATVPPDKT